MHDKIIFGNLLKKLTVSLLKYLCCWFWVKYNALNPQLNITVVIKTVILMFFNFSTELKQNAKKTECFLKIEYLYICQKFLSSYINAFLYSNLSIWSSDKIIFFCSFLFWLSFLFCLFCLLYLYFLPFSVHKIFLSLYITILLVW